MMDALAKHDPLDPASADVMKADFAGSVTKDVKGLKIGVVRHFFEKDAEIDPEIKAGIEAALVTFKDLGCEIVDVTLSPLAPMPIARR